MSSADYVRSRIELLRPRAKFVAYSHSSDFIDATANLGEGFHYVNLYDEQIDSNVIRSPHGLIIIHNTYLSSFAYNLLLCWLLCAGHPGRGHAVPTDLVTLLKHNFKKYFAEQLLHTQNNLFSRAIFLETLLFEQACMVPVFEAKSQDADLDRKAELGANIMSAIVSFHELGHFSLVHDSYQWDGVREQHAEAVDVLLSRITETYPAIFVEEFKCDTMSIISCLQQYEAEVGQEFCLRVIAFAFAAFAVLSSLTKSAKKTADDQKATADEVDFDSIQKRHRDYAYSIGIDTDFAERARLAAKLCENIAQKNGIVLFGEGGVFPLPSTILDDLLPFVKNVLESDNQNARQMSMLVAEALHEHPRGLDYLYLRSKTFKSERQIE